ncbi:hypothetical protein KJ973_02920 [Patescibacteria group bacterium]|nr:hypothetical protein [Patescibacteria group bacterium]MBU2009897.1 hypothetical protein [Patescibacteria group bacterium]MBU2416385.1 hypothetical protein [Patescibacteria group bacterium]MBU2460856.1 hypothetical protein [Patescibacteria group bacterium]
MKNNLWKRILQGRFFHSYNYDDIDPDEIFLDSSNLPEFDVYQFEGRLVKPISKTPLYLLGGFFILILLVFLLRIGTLQIRDGVMYAQQSENNRLAYALLFAGRGIIFDKDQQPLAWNIPNEKADFALRAYTATSGLAHILGYTKYPQADSSGIYYSTEYQGDTGVEKIYNSILNGVPGLKIVERNALMEIQSQNILEPPQGGKDLSLTIDTKIQTKLFELIKELALEKEFSGGAGIIMDVNNGAISALTSYPEYSSNVMVGEENNKIIKEYRANEQKPFFNRAISGRYTPGSIIKPFVALGALTEGVVTPEKKILSTGSITIPNKWNPELKTVFKDWKAHGWVDIKDALAVSSNVYFYEVGGGFEEQKGIGIKNIEKYARMFGIAELSGIDLPNEEQGVIPNPQWKAKNFDNEPWRIGDTYHTAIGQYGFGVTLIQMVRAVGGLATDGALVTPYIGTQKNIIKQITEISKQHFQIVKEGMRQAVTDGTARGLNVQQVKVAAKTGTAELGTTKKKVNSWVIGFFPYEQPKYAFVVMMEGGPRDNTIGALYIMRQLLDWMPTHAPEYLKPD